MWPSGGILFTFSPSFNTYLWIRDNFVDVSNMSSHILCLGPWEISLITAWWYLSPWIADLNQILCPGQSTSSFWSFTFISCNRSKHWWVSGGSGQCFFFFPAWKPKVCVKRFFGLFLSFFTHKKSLSRTLFCKFSRTARIFHGHFLWFFHAWILCFHGENLDIFRNFHVWVSFFSRVKNEEFGF